MDSEDRSPAFGEADSTTEQAPNCDGFHKAPCFRSPTLGSTTSLGPDFTVTTPTASLNSLSSLPPTASYSFVGTLTDPSSVTPSPNTVGLETPTAATITSTIAPVYTTETSPSETAPSDSSPHPNTKTTIAIVVPVVVGSVAIIIAIVAFLLWRRRRNSKANKNNRAAPGSEMSREAGPGLLPGNNRDRGQMDVGWSHAAFRESVPPTYQHHNISTPIIQSTTASEVTLMHSPLPPSNVPSPPPPPPPPPRYSTISARERSQLYNDERHSILTVENLAALHGWEGSEDTREVRDSRDEGAQSPFRDPSDGTSIISPVSDIDSPTARRHGNGDEDSLVSSLGDEHRGSHRMQ
ncbi:hypothetical protein DTO212C5_3949 [Paecilomyces variotii]|nr:hypothetical protein DTO212C5_3949 [Paecilomyces variotii]